MMSVIVVQRSMFDPQIVLHVANDTYEALGLARSAEEVAGEGRHRDLVVGRSDVSGVGWNEKQCFVSVSI